MKNYRELKVWDCGHQLTLELYRATRHFPRDELVGLTGQMRRAAVSIPANIAEGCGRDGDRELRRFLNIALGSACELDYLVQLATQLGYLNENVGQRFAKDLLVLRRMLGTFIQKLKASPSA